MKNVESKYPVTDDLFTVFGKAEIQDLDILCEFQ
jgi:hypothetical protein